MSEETGKRSDSTEKISHQLAKQINLPFYEEYKSTKSAAASNPGVVTSTVESYVRTVRLQCTGAAQSVKRFQNSVASKYNTAKAHSLGVVDFLQSEPELWKRCGIVAAAGLTGVIAAYRRPFLVKTRNVLLCSGAAGAICWPQQTVEAASQSYNYVKEPVVNWWIEYAPGSPYQPVTTSTVTPSHFYDNNKKVEEDLGQSHAADKDMYSTRDG